MTNPNCKYFSTKLIKTLINRVVVSINAANEEERTMEIQTRTLAGISAGNKFLVVALNSNSLKIQNFQIRSMHNWRVLATRHMG